MNEVLTCRCGRGLSELTPGMWLCNGCGEEFPDCDCKAVLPDRAPWAWFDGTKQQAETAIAAETAMVRMLAACPPGVEPTAMVEVKRRAGVLKSETAAIESVADDMVNGRWMA